MTTHSAPTIREAVRAIVDEANGDWGAAEIVIYKRLKDKAFRTQYQDTLIQFGIDHLIRLVARDNRQKYWTKNEQVEPQEDSGNGIRLLAEANALDMFGYEMQGGLHLGDATLDDLQAAIAHHEKHVTTNRQRAIFYLSIVSRMDKSKPVRKSITNDELWQLLLEAKDAA